MYELGLCMFSSCELMSETCNNMQHNLCQENYFSYGIIWCENIEVYHDPYLQQWFQSEICTPSPRFNQTLRIWGTLPNLSSLRRPLCIKQLRESLARTVVRWDITALYDDHSLRLKSSGLLMEGLVDIYDKGNMMQLG